MAADLLDEASELTEFHTQLRIKEIKSRGREHNPIGSCLWCAEPFEKESSQLFCDDDCVTDFAKANRK
jgi:hypothetical protein